MFYKKKYIMGKKVKMELIDKRDFGPVYKTSGTRTAATPNFKILQNWVQTMLGNGLLKNSQEVLVAYKETKTVGLTSDFPVETDQFKVFTAKQLAELKFEEVLQKA